MKKLTVSGSSDDLIEASGIKGCDEFNSYKSPYAGQLTVKSKSTGQSIAIHCIYSGHWCFAVGPLTGDYDAMPNWPITREWGTEEAYSETLTISCPDDAVLSFDRTEERDD